GLRPYYSRASIFVDGQLGGERQQSKLGKYRSNTSFFVLSPIFARTTGTIYPPAVVGDSPHGVDMVDLANRPNAGPAAHLISEQKLPRFRKSLGPCPFCVGCALIDFYSQAVLPQAGPAHAALQVTHIFYSLCVFIITAHFASPNRQKDFPGPWSQAARRLEHQPPGNK